MQLLVRFTIIQRLRFLCTAYVIVGLPVVGLSDGLQSFKECNYRVGFQSFKRCVSAALSMQLSVFWLLAYRTVYNHPKDAFLLN